MKSQYPVHPPKRQDEEEVVEVEASMTKTESSSLAGITDGGAAVRLEPGAEGRPTKIERSCIVCHQRKVGCDKGSPCANCVKAGVLCCYPRPERSARRLPKTTVNEVAARVARLERKVNAISSISAQVGFQVQPMSGIVPAMTEVDSEELVPSEDAGKEELLVQDGSSSRYINEVLLSRLLDEQKELQSVMGSPDDESRVTGEALPFDIGPMFSEFRQLSVDVRSHFPPRWHAMQLWRTYVHNVDPIMKILHVPTAEVTIYAALHNSVDISPDLNALLFSIFLAATTSLSPDDATNLLGQSRGVALLAYKQGLEQSLAAANFMVTPTVKALQAMVIYLSSFRALGGGRSIWPLNGLLIRLAQSMGLHRDGQNFNLSPFETEMRRRLWWFLYATDTRAAEDHGLSLTSFIESSDTHFPLNLDDSDLSQDIRELPAAKLRWTEMSFSLVIMKSGQVLQHVYRTVTLSDKLAQLDPSQNRIVDDLTSNLQSTYLQHCFEYIPIQHSTLLIARVMITKLRFIVQQQGLKPDHNKSSRSSSSTSEESLNQACEILELGLQLQTEELLKGFRWSFGTYPQFHPLMYVLWHLCLHPMSPSAERAWVVVDRSFDVAVNQGISFKAGSKWKIVRLLKEKAFQSRQSVTDRPLGDSITKKNLSAFNNLPHEVGNVPDLNFSIGDGTSWDMRTVDFADWSDYVGNIDNYGY